VSLAGSTRDTYNDHWRGWDRYRRAKGASPWLIDEEGPQQREQAVLEFLAVERVLHRNKGTTLGVKKAAIRSVFERAGLPDPTSGQRIKLMLRGARNEDGPGSTKQPAMLRHLMGVYQVLREKQLGRKGTAMWAAMCLGYFFTLRSRNYAAENRKGEYDERDILRRKDVQFVTGEGPSARVVVPTRENAHLISRMIIKVRRSKTDPTGAGFERAINANSHPQACAVKAVLAHFLLTAGLPDEYPVCSYDAVASGVRAKSVISRDEVANALKAVAMQMGESMDDMGSHSLRIGGATAMAAAAIPDNFIMYWGFWKSAAYLGYVRHVKEDPWEKHLAERIVSQDLHTSERQWKPTRTGSWGDKADGQGRMG